MCSFWCTERGGEEGVGRRGGGKESNLFLKETRERERD